jgi:hypothetical protein
MKADKPLLIHKMMEEINDCFNEHRESQDLRVAVAKLIGLLKVDKSIHAINR